MKWFECVPNFSEGRDAARIERIVAPARAAKGVVVLDVESNADHNRCVVSLAGEGGPLAEAVFEMMRVAVREIDLNHHKGQHPRMGAVDVVPFVPLGEATDREAVQLAERLGERVAKELGIPVFLYALAARRPERSDLGVVRKGEFEGLRESIATDPARTPDYGPGHVHPTAGAVAIGARPVLIAYNAYLTTPDVAVAKKVAHAIRARDGGLAEVKALGFDIAERHRAQVSMNLTDYRKTPVHRALEMVRREAARYGVAIEESEVVGLIPEDALLDAAEYYLQLNRFERATILERKLRGASPGIGPSPSTGAGFAGLALSVLLDRLAARTPTPGGGSAAAAAAAMGIALGEMVFAYSMPAANPTGSLAAPRDELTQIRTRLLQLVDEDSAAYDTVRAAIAARKASPGDAATQRGWETAVRHAAEVPLESARNAARAIAILESHRSEVKTSVGSDLVTALALLRAGREGALANVAINLEDLKNAGLPIGDLVADMERYRSDHP